MSSLDEMKQNEELDDCPEISDEQVKIMSLVLSRPGVRGNSRASFYYQGMEEARVSAIRNLMGGMSMTLRQAMEALKIPSDEYDKYAAVI